MDNVQQPGMYNPIIRRLNFQNQQQPERDHYIHAFGALPDFILKTHGILASDLNEGSLGELLNDHRDIFSAIHQWIIYFQDHTNNPVDDLLEFSLRQNDYKLHAEESWALLHLCEEIVQRDPCGWKNSNPSLFGAELWFSCNYERLEGTFFRTGILGGTGERISKQASCDKMSRQTKEDFETLHSRKFASASRFNPSQIQRWDSTEEAIRVAAEYIAQHDSEFLHTYSDYTKLKKRVFRSVRNNPQFQAKTLKPDGSINVGAKGKRGKGKKKSPSKKGFGKQM